MSNIVTIKRLVKAREKNPNGYYTNNLEQSIAKYIEDNKKIGLSAVSMYDIRDVDNFSNRMITDMRLLCGEPVSFTDEDITIRLYDTKYKEDIINNTNNYQALISYVGYRDVESKEQNVYNVERILKIQLRKKGVII